MWMNDTHNKECYWITTMHHLQDLNLKVLQKKKLQLRLSLSKCLQNNMH